MKTTTKGRQGTSKLFPKPLQNASTLVRPQPGLGLAGIAAANTISDRTLAYINDSGTVTLGGGKLDVNSTDHTSISSRSGAASFVKTAKSSAAIAGSYSVNELDMQTDAFIAGARVENVGIVTVSALRDGDVVAITAGVGVGLAKGPVATGGADYAGSIGASVSTNRVKGKTSAAIDTATLYANDSVALNANDGARISALAIGGALAYGATTTGTSGALAGAGAGIINEVTLDIVAEIRKGSMVGTSAGAVSLNATDSNVITADAGGVALSLASAKAGNTFSSSLGVAVALNTVTNRTRSSIDESTVTATGDIELNADDHASISAFAVGGALAVGQSTTGATLFAGAGAATINTVSLATEASISNGSDVESTGGSVTLSAINNADINADAGGVALALAPSNVAVAVSVGASAAVNTVANGVQAFIDGSEAIAGGNVEVKAQSTSDVDRSFDFGQNALGQDNSITLTGHGLQTGDLVRYRNTGGALAGALIDGQTYVVFKVDENHIRLMATKANAVSEDGEAVDLKPAGTGTYRLETFNARIDALAIAGAISASLGGMGALSGSGAAAYTRNSIDDKVKAYVKNASRVKAKGEASFCRRLTNRAFTPTPAALLLPSPSGWKPGASAHR